MMLCGLPILLDVRFAGGLGPLTAGGNRQCHAELRNFVTRRVCTRRLFAVCESLDAIAVGSTVCQKGAQ
jgi:hypothetical protein